MFFLKQIKFLLPEGFHPDIISDTLPHMPKKNKVAVYEHISKVARIIVTETTVKARNFELPYYKLFYERLFASQKATLLKSAFTRINKKNGLKIEFTNKVIIRGENEDEMKVMEYRNSFLILIAKGKLTLINFSVPGNSAKEWDNTIDEFISSISISKSWFPKIRRPKKKKKMINRNLKTFFDFLHQSAPDDFNNKASGVWHQPFYSSLMSIVNFQKKIQVKRFKKGKTLAQFYRNNSLQGYFYANRNDKISDHSVFADGLQKRLISLNKEQLALCFYLKEMNLDNQNQQPSKKQTIVFFEKNFDTGN